jgi:hypothetical protein
MKIVQKKPLRYELTIDEKIELSKVALRPWKKFYVPKGEISNKSSIESHLYRIPQIIIGHVSDIVVFIDSMDVSETELYRVSAAPDRDGSVKMSMRTQPQFAELKKFPNDLKMDRFLEVSNELSLLRFCVEIEDGFGSVLGEAIVDSGLLISNATARMVLYPCLAVPLDMCITTDERKVGELLSRAVEIERLTAS